MLVKKPICRFSHLLREDMTAWPTSKLQLSFWKCGFSIFKYHGGSPETIHLLKSLAEVAREGKQAERYLQHPQFGVHPADKIPSARRCHGLTTACSSRIRNWRPMLECGYRVPEPRWPFCRRRNGR